MSSDTIPETFRDLLFASIASLTTIGAGGGPQATLVWFAFDEEDQKLKVSLAADRVKTKNILARPQVSLLIPDPEHAMRYMDVRATAHAEIDPDYAWASVHVNPKYGADVRNFDAPGSTRYVVSLESPRFYAVDQRQ